MIVMRKVYSSTSKRSPLPDQYPIPDEWEGKYDSVEYDVSIIERRYSDEMKDYGPIDKKKIRGLKKDLEDGFIYTDGPNGGDTHYLTDQNKYPNKFHLMSKKINTSDRMNYGIYPPKLDEIRRRLIIPITIWTIKGHTIYGQGTYSDNEMKNID